MLVLNRKDDEELVIETSEGKILIKVLNIDSKNVKLGIEAPRKFLILRKELYDRVYQENIESISDLAVGSVKDLFPKNTGEDG